jgi:hypothetical protein
MRVIVRGVIALRQARIYKIKRPLKIRGILIRAQKRGTGYFSLLCFFLTEKEAI